MALTEFFAPGLAIRDRLKAQIPELKAVAELQEALLSDAAIRAPGALVIYSGLKPKDSNGGRLLITQDWEIIIVVDAPNDATGGKARAEAGPLIVKVLQSLVGWKPAQGCSAIELTGRSADYLMEDRAHFSFTVRTNVII